MFIELHVPVILNKNNCTYPISTTFVGNLSLHQLNALGANGTEFETSTPIYNLHHLTCSVDLRSSNGEVSNSFKMMNFFGISMRFAFNCLHEMEKQKQPRVIEIPFLAFNFLFPKPVNSEHCPQN